MRLQPTHTARRGVILMVVLAMLTLFAIVGISFVLYADSEATSARIAREAESLSRPDMDPEQCLAFFLGQLIYDNKDDIKGINSALRGHSFARSMYGYNYTLNGNNLIVPVGNNVPFNGSGRLNYTDTAASMPASQRVNYILFNTGGPGSGIITDPERVGQRNNPGQVGTTTFVGGFNPPYTYPDLNSFFLAAVKADGTVISPSFHRNWLFGALNNTGNANWNPPNCFYLTPRPSPVVNPGFPYPEDAGGDVKNLVWAPGGNDSIWIDVGAPVMTAPDGTLYKMLVAPLIIDLDGRVNLNVAGNILGQGNTHVSNQGWGGWETNLFKIVSQQGNATNVQELQQLFLGNGRVPGKYGPNQAPSGAQAATGGRPGHFYAPGDINSLNEAAPNQPSSQPTPPVGPTTPFATFAQGYQSGGTELQSHPSLFDVYRSAMAAMTITGQANDDRVFSAGAMEPLLRPTSVTGLQVDTGSVGLFSDLLRLCPTTLGPQAASPRFRNLITTISNDLAAPGSMPWWYTSPANTYGNAANPLQAPFIATPLPSPTFNPMPAAGASPWTPPPAQPSEFNQINNMPVAQAIINSIPLQGRINLNQQLVPYPHMGSGFVAPYGAALVTYGTPYNMAQQNIQQQYTAAVQARQTLANDIYRRLLNVTGINGNTAPGDANLTAHRWLAQLAVNIVDFIDEDDISTPFNFSNTQDGLQANQIGTTAGGDTAGAANTAAPPPPSGANPTFWVFGTELPRVVLNEVVIQTNAVPAPAASPGAQVQVWAELYNPMPAAMPPATPNVQPYDFNRVPLYMAPAGGGQGYSPYRISVSNALMTAMLPPNGNVLGKPAIVPGLPGPPVTSGYPFETTDNDFAAAQMTGGGAQAAGAGPVAVPGVDPQGFFLVGPPAPVAAPFMDPFVPPGVNVPVVRTASMSAMETYAAVAVDERTTGLTVCLRRLANPYLPFDGTPTDPTYNPYVTVDYLTSVPMNVMVANLAAPINSRGKTQPYAAFSQVTPNTTTALPTSPVVDQAAPNAKTVNNVNNTFGLQNSPFPTSGNYDWLVFLDRMPISPIELLHVPAYQPYQLTQQFMTGADNVSANAFQHLAPWGSLPTAGNPLPINPALQPANGSTLLYRLLEQFECGNRANGVDSTAYTPGRIPGKININTIWDPEVFLALCDANASLGTTPPMNDTIMLQIFANLMQSRSPGVATPPATGPQLTQTDIPFLPLSVGVTAAGDPQYPQGLSMQNTILRANPTNPQLLLLENPGNQPANGANVTMHPYNRYQLLTKIFNNITTRSNTFAVFMTVGFFQVTNPNASPPTLGPEIGRAEGRHIRHRMFAIVDRTNLAAFSTPLNAPITAPAANAQPTPIQLQTVMNTTGTNSNTGATWQVVQGMQLTVEPGTDNEETITVQVDGNGNPIATFLKQHPNPNLNNPPQTQVIVNRGNPGPWLRYDPRQDPWVVPYYSIID